MSEVPPCANCGTHHFHYHNCQSPSSREATPPTVSTTATAFAMMPEPERPAPQPLTESESAAADDLADRIHRGGGKAVPKDTPGDIADYIWSAMHAKPAARPDGVAHRIFTRKAKPTGDESLIARIPRAGSV